MAEKLEVQKDKDCIDKQLKLVVFGATGVTGTEVVKQGLELGHEITAIVRTPENFTLKHEKLKIVKGDAYHIDTFEAELYEKDAVLSCVGSTAIGPFATTTLYSDTVKVIIEAMKRHSVSRFVVLTSWCTRKGDPNSPWYFEWILRPFLLGGPLSDMVIMEDFIESTDPSEINYTIVKPPQLTYAAGNANYKIEEGQCNTNTKASIPRADVAHFMLASLQTDGYDRKVIAIASL